MNNTSNIKLKDTQFAPTLNSTYNEEKNIVLASGGTMVYENKPFVEGITEKAVAQTYTKGIGTITVTNGSGVASGNGSTNWTSSDPIRGMSFWLNCIFKDSNNVWYRVASITVNNATQFTSAAWYSNALLINGGATSSTTYSGVSGTYEYYIVRNFADQYSIALGTNSIATNFSMAFGSGSAASGSASIALGSNNAAKGTNNFVAGQNNYGYTGIGAVALGRRTRSAGNGSFAGGSGVIVAGSTADSTGAATDKRVYALGQASFNFSENTAAQTAAHGALAANSVILGGLNHNIPSNSLRSVILGGNLIKAISADTDTVYMPKVRIGHGTAGALTSGSTSVDLIVRNVGGILQTRTTASVIALLGANNGVRKSGDNFRLGGLMTGSTNIGLNTFNLIFTGTTGTLRYGSDVSANFNVRSLVDKGYVTGTTWFNNITTDLKLTTVGTGIYIKEGVNATMGVATLVAGTVVISTTKVTANSRIFLTSQGGGANHGTPYISARSVGASFTITSTNGADTDVIAWEIKEPA